MHVSEVTVHTTRSLEVTLDGEGRGTVPADFEVAGEAIRVVTPLDFEDVDDLGGSLRGGVQAVRGTAASGVATWKLKLSSR
jgi:hypothetical protein